MESLICLGILALPLLLIVQHPWETLVIVLVLGTSWYVLRSKKEAERSKEEAYWGANYDAECLRGALKEEARLRAIKLAGVDAMTGRQFEEYVARLLENEGFQIAMTPESNDFGVDIIAQKETAKYAVQVKRYKSKVAGAAISAAVAGKAFYDCSHCMVITNSHFTQGATRLAQANQCVLVDRDEIIQWIMSYQAETEGEVSSTYCRWDSRHTEAPASQAYAISISDVTVRRDNCEAVHVEGTIHNAGKTSRTATAGAILYDSDLHPIGSSDILTSPQPIPADECWVLDLIVHEYTNRPSLQLMDHWEVIAV